MPAAGKRKNGNHKTRPFDGPDEEELRLTESLFGGGIVNRTKKIKRKFGSDSEEEGHDDNGSRPVQAEVSTVEQLMKDEDLFVVDAGVDDEEEDQSVVSSDSSSSDSSSEDEDDDDDEGEDESDDEEREEEPTHNPDKPLSTENIIANKLRRKAVWTDPSSSTLTIPISGKDAKAADGSHRGMNKIRNLRENADEVYISGTEYELRLRRMFEKIHPRPRWASLELRNGNTSNNGISSIGDLFNTDKSLVNRITSNSHRQGRSLPKQKLEIQRLRNVNESESSRSSNLASIEQVAFHPGTRNHVMLTTSKDRRLRFYHVDTRENPLLESIHFPDLPLRTAAFHPSGSSVLLTGTRPFFYVHDMYSGKTLKSSPWRGNGDGGDDTTQERDLSLARFAPAHDGGKQLAIGGRRGGIYLLDFNRTGGSGGGSLIGRMQMNAPLSGLSWDPANENRLVSISNQGTIHSWDTRQMRCEVQRQDAGLFAPKGIQSSPSGQWWAVGSEDGTVNMYGREAVEGNISNSLSTTPISSTLDSRKTLSNIVTSTTTLEFNPTGEILAIASSKKKDVLKMVHLPSLTIFENWPTSGTPLGHVSSVGFSSGSEFMAMGNSRGKVLLYSLQHYS